MADPYINPPELIREIGRPLTLASLGDYNGLMRLVRPNERLFYFTNNGAWQVAGMVKDADEHKAIDAADLMGAFISLFYYAVPVEALVQHGYQVP